MTSTIAFDRSGVRGSADLIRTERLRLSRGEPGTLPDGHRWAPAAEQMTELCAEPPNTIGDVLSKLTRAQGLLALLPPPEANRIASFNSLYYTITDRVAQALSGPTVKDPEFLERLDVQFARLYFEALRQWGANDERTPEAWEILFRRAQDKSISALAAAMLGVNAHINHDLALALMATWTELGSGPGERVHPDYLIINKIFYREIPRLRRRYSSRWQLRVDVLVGDLDDWSQNVVVAATRAAAWEQAERLWALRADPDDLEHALLLMNRASALVGEMVIHGDGLSTRMVAMLIESRDRARNLLTRRRGLTG
jgi:hypothetical protein